MIIHPCCLREVIGTNKQTKASDTCTVVYPSSGRPLAHSYNRISEHSNSPNLTHANKPWMSGTDHHLGVFGPTTRQVNHGGVVILICKHIEPSPSIWTTFLKREEDHTLHTTNLDIRLPAPGGVGYSMPMRYCGGYCGLHRGLLLIWPGDIPTPPY